MADNVLTGIRVLDLGHYVAAPYTAWLFAMLGADVIKVEKPKSGDAARQSPPLVNGVSLLAETLNHNKKGVTADLHTEGGKKLLRELIAESDVLLANFRPGVMEKLGFGYEDIKKINPKMVVVFISGYGQNGPYKDRRVYDIAATAASAVLSANMTKDGPKALGVPAASVYSAVFAAYGVMLALYDRLATGEGQFIDIAMTDSVFTSLTYQIPKHDTGDGDLGAEPLFGQSADPMYLPSNVYKCKNGFCDVFGDVETIFPRFAKITGNPELQSEKYATHEGRISDYARADGLIADWFAAHTVEEAEEACNQVGMPCGIVFTIERLLNNDNAKARGLYERMDVPGVGNIAFPTYPFRLATNDIEPMQRCPELGEHNEEIYSQLLGLSLDEIDELRQADAI